MTVKVALTRNEISFVKSAVKFFRDKEFMKGETDGLTRPLLKKLRQSDKRLKIKGLSKK